MADRFDSAAQGSLALLRVLGGGERPPEPKRPPRRDRRRGAVGLERRGDAEGRELPPASEVIEHPEAATRALECLAAVCEGLAAMVREPSAFVVVLPDGGLEIDDAALRERSAEAHALVRACSPALANDPETPAQRHLRHHLEAIARLSTLVAFAPIDVLRPLYVGPLERPPESLYERTPR